MSEGEDTWGCIVGVVCAIAGGIWLWNTYEIKRRDPAPVTIPSPEPKPTLSPFRPTGLIAVGADKNGGIWKLNADTVAGPPTKRQGWGEVDAGVHDKSATRKGETLYLADCTTGAVKVLSAIGYDAHGGIVFNDDTDPEKAKTVYYPPGSMGAEMIMNLCDPVFGK